MVVPGHGPRKILREFQIIAARRGHGSAAAVAGSWSVAVIADMHAARRGNTSSAPRSVESILIAFSLERAQHRARGVVMLPVLAPLRGRPARLRSPRVRFEIAAGGGCGRHDARAEEVAHDPVSRGPVVASVRMVRRADRGQGQVQPLALRCSNGGACLAGAGGVLPRDAPRHPPCREWSNPTKGG